MPLDRGPSPLRPPPFGGMASYHVQPMSPVDKEFHPVFHAGAVAVITGAASGIGRAAAQELAKLVLPITSNLETRQISDDALYNSFPFWLDIDWV